jgi:hypothetical protein
VLREDGFLEPLTESAHYTAKVVDLNDPWKVETRRLEQEARRHRLSLVHEILELMEEPGESEDPLLRNRSLPILQRAARELRDSYIRLPEAVDLDADRVQVKLFDCLEAEKELTPFILSHLRQTPTDIMRLDAYVFEQLVAEFFASWGYSVQLLGRDPRSGADIMALSAEEPLGIERRYLIEVKRHRNRIGIEEIRRTLGVFALEKERYGWDIAFLVSASGFRDFRMASVSDLRHHGLVLKDGLDIKKWLGAYKPRTDGGLWLPQAWEDGLGLN